MGSRRYSRQPNGRFRRPTLENMLGLSAPPCPSCGRLNPHAVNEPPPENCHACGAPMKPEAEPDPPRYCTTCRLAGNDDSRLGRDVVHNVEGAGLEGILADVCEAAGHVFPVETEED